MKGVLGWVCCLVAIGATANARELTIKGIPLGKTLEDARAAAQAALDKRPRPLFFKSGMPAGHNTTLQLKVDPAGAVRVSGGADAVQVVVPLRFEARADWFTKKLFAKIRHHEDTHGTVDLIGDVRFHAETDAQGACRLATRTTCGHRWVERPFVQVGPVRVRISGKAGEALQRHLQPICEEVNRAINHKQMLKTRVCMQAKAAPPPGPTRLCLQAHSGHYVVSESNRLSVNANRPHCREWEQHRIEDLNGGALESGDVVHIVSYHDRLWSAQPNGALHANRTNRDGWEKFTLERIGGGGPIRTGDRVAIRSAHGRYVVAEAGGGRHVAVNRPQVGEWERFTVTFLP